MSETIPTHVQRLGGCRPTPLAHYLKALGILRIVAGQSDNSARGWWRDDDFYLSSMLDETALVDFFLHHYSPTPLIAPWNGGSGFYPKDNKLGIDPICNSRDPRFEDYRIAIAEAKQAIGGLQEKPSKGEEKNGVIAACRLRLRGPGQRWIDAALALGADGEPAFPAMLGTGGNDGRLDFTSNYMQRLTGLFDLSGDQASPQPHCRALLAASLFGTASCGLDTKAIGQFFPSAAGGPNGSTGFEGGIGVNPWDYVLMLEGAVLFASGLSRRFQVNSLAQAAAPFAVRSSGAGYGSSDQADVGPRGEQWMPLWNQPATLRELASLLREGKSEINGRPAGRGTDMARSVARMGVARGITQFERYGYIERNGLSNLAVPLGRFIVEPKPNQRLLDSIAVWIDRLRQLATDQLAPASLARAYRSCEQAIFNCARRGGRQDFLELLIAAGRAEDQFMASPRFCGERALPIGRLPAAWLPAIAEDSAEFRLGLALAAQSGPLASKSGNAPLRVHWLPIDAKGNRFLKGENGLAVGPEQCAIGADLTRAAISVMQRRLLAMNRGLSVDGKSHCLPLRLINHRLGARWQDIAAFLNGETDDARILAIARGLMPIHLRDAQLPPRGSAAVKRADWSKSLFGVLRLSLPTDAIRIDPRDAAPSALLSAREPVPYDVRCNPAVFHSLVRGDLTNAFSVAYRQLSQAGLRPKMSFATASPQFARRLAAAMIFGLSPKTVSELGARILAVHDVDDQMETSSAPGVD